MKRAKTIHGINRSQVRSAALIAVVGLGVLLVSLPVSAAPNRFGQEPVKRPQTEEARQQREQSGENEEAAMAAAVGRTSLFLERLLSSVNQLTTNIAASTSIPSAVRDRVMADLAADRAFFEQQQTALHAATTLAEVRTVAVDTRDYIRERRARVQQHRAEFAEAMKQRIVTTQQKSAVMIERLKTVSGTLEKLGVDTTAFDELIAEHEVTMDVLNADDLNPQTVRDTVVTMKTQISTIKTTVQSLIQAAKVLNPQIVPSQNQ